MTDWQWQVVIALCRAVVRIEGRTNDDNHESFDMQQMKDISTLQEAIDREPKPKVCIHSGKQWWGDGKCPFCLDSDPADVV